MGKVLHASGSGYFPTCIQEASSPDHCPWTLEKAMQTYWRVRTWTFSVSGLEAEAGDPEEFFPFSVTIDNITSGNSEDESNYNSEKQLVCSNGFFFNTVDDDIFAVIGFGNPEKSNDLYTSGINGYMYNENLVCEFRVYPEYPQDEPGVNNSGTITVLGATLPLFIYIFDPEVTITFADVVATLTPTEWWSYGGTYNTSTGARL
jgi:hypothetical protein